MRRRHSHWESLYATLNPFGDLVISRRTHEILGSPDSYLLLFDVERNVIGLRPADGAAEKNAYPGSAGAGDAAGAGSGRCG